MMLTLREIASALGGEVAGREVVAPGPNHSRKDRSLGVVLSRANPDGFVCRSYSGDDWRACRDYVAGRLGLPQWEPGRRDQPDDIIGRMQARARRIEAEKVDEADRQNRINYAVKVLNEAGPITGTLAEIYMTEKRGLRLDAEAASTLRFHPSGPWGKGGRAPMMIAPMTNIMTGEITGIHRTALTPDAEKVDRKMLGVAADTAIMLVPGTGSSS